MEPKNAKLEELDLRMISAVGICLLLLYVLQKVGLSNFYNALVAAIATLFCTQYTKHESIQAGKTRFTVISIGGLLGLIVAALDNIINKQLAFFALILIGILMTLFICKLTKALYIHCKIGCVGFLVVSLALSGTMRIDYGISLIVSTIIGVIISLLVTMIWSFFRGERIISQKQF